MNDVRSPEQIERDIDELRAQISNTLDAVQMKLSPGQMLDHALTYAKDGGAIAANIGRGMRENPLPASLLGIGLGWLYWSGSRKSEVRTSVRRSAIDDRELREARENLDRIGSDLAHIRDTTTEYVRANPASSAAIAVAAGALLGAFLLRKRR